MALTKQKLALPFIASLDTKTDDKQEVTGSLSVLENATFNKPGKLIKRNGHENILTKTSANVDIINKEALSAYKDELTTFADNKLYSRITSIDKWSEKGNVFTIVPDSTPIVRVNEAQSSLDSVHSGGLNAYVYQDSTGVSLSLVDNVSKNFIINKQVISATGITPKVVARDNKIYIIYVDATAIKYRSFSIYDFNDIAAEITAVAAIDGAAKEFDAIIIADKIMLAYSEAVGAALTFKSINIDDTLSSEVTVAGETPSVAINLSTDAASRLICTYYDASDAKIVIFNYTLGVKILAETSLETIANVTNITAIESSSENYTVLYEVSDTATYDHFIKLQTVDLAASLGTPAVLLRSVGLASKIFEHDNNFYFTAIYNNTLQSSYFLSDISGRLVSKISPSTAGNVLTTGLPRISAIDDNNYLLTSQVKGKLEEDNGTFFSVLGVNSTNIDFTPDIKYANRELAENMHIAGGFLKMYDGTQVVEHGFHLYPEGLAAGATNAAGGQMSDGTYEYIGVYRWTDGQGIVHRSAASIAVSVTLSAGGATQKQIINVPTLRLTEKTNVVIELYRTEDSGTIFYKVLEAANDKTANLVAMDNTLYTDAQLISQEVLYTTGGVLENLPAPAGSIISSYKDRIFTTTPKSSKWNYSKIRNEGYPVEFNDTLEVNISPVGGDNVVSKAMDDKLILFKESAIHYLSGDGPNNLGEQDSFITPELISSEVGCSNPNSVVLTPIGMLFKSDKGIYRLSRSLGLDYIGAPVEEFNDLTITSAVMVPNKNQVRFTTSDGDCLVYNYFQNKWSTFTNYKALSATTLGTDYYYLRSGGLVYKEDDSWNDNGTSIKTKVESSWISFDGVQGYQRVYRLLLLGAAKSAHKLKIKIAYNYIDAWIQEKIIDTSDFTDLTAYGDSSPYGAESTYGADNLYQLRMNLKKQKCQSIKISIEDIQETVGEGMELSNILFVVGVKTGEFKTGDKYATE